jgi:peptidoglycan/LPS O-acetylase OafA/YrhL
MNAPINIATFAMPNPPRWHSKHIDALRGIAILGVLLVHSSLNLKLPSTLAAIAFSGQRGVQLFFIVSAFTLSLSYENRRDEQHPIINFFLRRFFRLFPMYYIAIALSCFLTPELAGPPTDVVLAILFLQGFTPGSISHGAIGGWTIACEAIFYMSLPFLLCKVRTLKAALLWLATIAPLLFVSCTYLGKAFPSEKEYLTFFWFPVESPVFLMGVASYFFWKEHIKYPNDIAPERSKLLSLTLLTCAYLIYAYNLPITNAGLYFSSLPYALLIIALALHPWPLLVNRMTTFLGKISFSVYLLHFHILFWVERIIKHLAITNTVLHSQPVMQFWAIFITTLIMTSLVATCTWYLIETPGIRLGRRLIVSLERRQERVRQGVAGAPRHPSDAA